MHHAAFRRFLHAAQQDLRASPKSNRAKDKLIRLSPTQFHELSTDVYDELLRRQQAAPPPGRPGPPRPDIPPFLPPRKEFHEKRNQARQKLATLQHQRFRDLAMDVFRELERRFPHFVGARGPPPNGMPPPGYGPPARGPGPNGYPFPPRSQSRNGFSDRMSGGPPPPGGPLPGGPPGSPMGRFPPRQGSLSVLPPQGVNGNGGPLPKSFQSNTMVPNKSTLVEDDDEVAGLDSDADARSDAFALDSVLQSRRGTTTTLGEGERKLLQETQAQVSSLQEKVQQLEELIKEKDEQVLKLQERDKSQVSEDERKQWDSLKEELQSKISKAEDLNISLQSELDKVRSEHEDMERQLQTKIQEASERSSADVELQAKFNNLEDRYQKLQSELRQQEQVTEEVRRQASDFLLEMRALSEESQSNWEREERLSSEVRRLETEVKEWQNRYAKAKTQLRHLRTSTVGIADSRPDVGAFAKENELLQHDGLVKDMHVTNFQISIDELLHVARSEDPSRVLQQMKVTIMAVRRIIQDVETLENHEHPVSPVLVKIKSRVPATANNMITASRNFANANGLSPVSLLDAAASHLSAAVIELIRLVKIRPTPADELEEDDDIPEVKSPGYFYVPPSQEKIASSESLYSPISTPDLESHLTSHFPLPPKGIPNGLAVDGKSINSAQPEEHDLQELKIYLDDQTDGLVRSIDALVASIRAEDGLTDVRIHISSISSVVDNILSSTESVMHQPTDAMLQERVGSILQTLDDCRNRLIDTAIEGEDNTEHAHDITGKLPPIAFEIARKTKELVYRLDYGESDGKEDEDFR